MKTPEREPTVRKLRPAVPTAEFLLGRKKIDPFGVLQLPVEQPKVSVVAQQEEAAVKPLVVPDPEQFVDGPGIEPTTIITETNWSDENLLIDFKTVSSTLEDDVLGFPAPIAHRKRRPWGRRIAGLLSFGVLAYGFSQVPGALHEFDKLGSKEKDQNNTRLADTDQAKSKVEKVTGIKVVLPTELPIVPESPTPTPTRTKSTTRASLKPVARESKIPSQKPSTQPETSPSSSAPTQSPEPKPSLTNEPTSPATPNL